MVALFSCISTSFSQTYYYKLMKKSVNDVVFTDVSGGQFITFMADICYESDKRGLNVGHGILSRGAVSNQFITYKGDSYWGANTTFKFKADLSKLNVITAGGDIWVYTRVTPLASVTTCSLIRKGGQKRQTETDYPVVSPSNNNSMTIINNNTYNNASSSSTNSYGNKKVRKNIYYETCSSCHGTGYQQGYTSTPYYGGVRVKEYCPICKRRVYPHTHNSCSRCHGTGQVKRTNYSYE